MGLRRKKTSVNKEPGLFTKLVTIYYEQALRRRALRILSKQQWSVDFLSALLVRSAKSLGTNVQIEIKDPAGRSFVMTYTDAAKSHTAQQLDDSIFNHLDDDIAINEYIRQNSRR